MAAKTQIYATGACARALFASRRNAQKSTGPKPTPPSRSTPSKPARRRCDKQPARLARLPNHHTIIMQNEANLLDAKMNVTSVETKYYENARLRRRRKTNPNEPNCKRDNLTENPKKGCAGRLQSQKACGIFVGRKFSESNDPV